MRQFRFESLEQRAVLDAASAALVGFTDYLQNSVFSQYDGDDYAIAILDTGADMNHDVFGDDVNPADGVPDRIVHQYDYVNLDNDATDDNVFGAQGHGTQVAGTIAELAPDADLIILKVLDDTGTQTDESVYEAALSWIYANRTNYNIVAVNMSWGDLMNHATETTAPAFSNELALLANAGVACIASAGNLYANWNDEFLLNGAPGVQYPAADPAVIAVGATWVADTGNPAIFQERAEDNQAWDYIQYTDKITAFSQRHETLLDIFAPGADLTTAYVGGGYITEQKGTSGAAPHVTAAIALAQQLNDVFEFSPNRLTQSELVTLLKDTGVEIFDPSETDEINDNFDSVINTELYYKRLDFEAMAYKLYKPSTPDLVNTSDWGFSESDNITGDVTPTFNGTAPSGSYVWLFVDGQEKASGQADGSGNYSLTSAALGAGAHSITIKVAEDSSVTTNRSQSSSALSITTVASDELDPVTSTFRARLSEDLVIEGENTGTSKLEIDWSTSPTVPPRTLTKTGSGIVTIPGQQDDITDRTESVTYFANEGTTVFTADTGVSATGQTQRVATWTIEANATVEFMTTQNLAALAVGASGFAKMTESEPPNYTVLYTSSLGFAQTGGNATGTLDITNNAIVIDFATVSEAQNNAGIVRGWIIDGRGGQGFGNGRWDGTGIISSTADAWNAMNPEERAIGYAVNADLPSGAHSVFVGEFVDGSSILIRYTIMGDANLNGTVDDDDVTVVGAFYNPSQTNPNWAHGDFDYNDFVDDDDVTVLGVFYGQSLETE